MATTLSSHVNQFQTSQAALQLVSVRHVFRHEMELETDSSVLA